MPKTFRDLSLLAPVQRALDDAGFETPTPIQRAAIPRILDGHDLIGVAETGTGKTLAYLLPIFEGLDLEQREPQAVVICPTRELAIQVSGEAKRFGEPLGVRIVLAYGGTSSGDQKRALAAGCHLVVATPGRLLDFVNSAWLSMRKVRFAVLDEADRMLDMGFINDVDAILRRVPMSRQTLLFSATFSEEVRALTERYMFQPELVQMHTGTRVAHRVDHALYPVASNQKAELLVEIMQRERPDKALIFTATREGTSELARRLRARGFEVLSLSSLLSQANRERALNSFRRGESPVLVATDVAARGLDITDIDLVVNFDVPMRAEDYVHRIGRTGRAEREGQAVTLISEDDDRRVADIERLLGEKVERLLLEGFDYAAMPRPRGRRSAGSRGRSAGRGRGGTRRGGASDSRRQGGKRSGKRRRTGSGSRSGDGRGPSKTSKKKVTD